MSQWPDHNGAKGHHPAGHQRSHHAVGELHILRFALGHLRIVGSIAETAKQLIAEEFSEYDESDPKDHHHDNKPEEHAISYVSFRVHGSMVSPSEHLERGPHVVRT